MRAKSSATLSARDKFESKQDPSGLKPSETYLNPSHYHMLFGLWRRKQGRVATPRSMRSTNYRLPCANVKSTLRFGSKT